VHFLSFKLQICWNFVAIFFSSWDIGFVFLTVCDNSVMIYMKSSCFYTSKNYKMRSIIGRDIRFFQMKAEILAYPWLAVSTWAKVEKRQISG
jgi:hypothetical protein